MSELLLEGNARDYNFIIITRSFVFMMSLIGCLSQDMMLAAMQEAGVSALRIGEMVEAGLWEVQNVRVNVAVLVRELRGTIG